MNELGVIRKKKQGYTDQIVIPFGLAGGPWIPEKKGFGDLDKRYSDWTWFTGPCRTKQCYMQSEKEEFGSSNGTYYGIITA